MSSKHFHFRHMLDQELAAAQSLHQLLENELSSLKARDIKQLEKINGLKVKHLKALQQLSQERCEWMQQANIELSAQCIKHPLICHEDRQEQQQLEQTWQQLADQFDSNSHLTEVLQLVVLQAKQRTQTMLALLKGQSQDKMLYTKQGQGKTQSRSNGYISA